MSETMTYLLDILALVVPLPCGCEVEIVTLLTWYVDARVKGEVCQCPTHRNCDLETVEPMRGIIQRFMLATRLAGLTLRTS